MTRFAETVSKESVPTCHVSRVIIEASRHQATTKLRYLLLYESHEIFKNKPELQIIILINHYFKT